MIRRFLSLIVLVWVIGFLWFVVALPRPAQEPVKTDAVIVPTGGPGRIARGLEVLDKGLAAKMLVSGVDREVRPQEFAAQFGVSPRRMACCVTLGFAAVDTRSNASETAKWVAQNEVRSLRLVTTDWHMRRAAGELDRTLPDHVTVIRDAVPSQADFKTLFLEYHKLLASRALGLADL
ncbi:YdcF family protein [Erythrobacter sp. BLCC-B19]|uniref:YdcF family protein n=1 Tax=Erythrobacter sp. BLCC-B19 TaxID=3025315 RepID=UPI00236251E8|nr:YdcF family protein [Erythrobacter sp. BLCC-B19]WDA42625.1 YdcF family protein [Erythrobacter sp. BLCC-B19]